MRNLKRFLAMTLTMLMVVGCFSFASFAQTFEDAYDPAFTEAIDILSDIDVIKGYEDGMFGQDDLVARWHMALWIAKLETGKVTDDDLLTIWKAESNFTDFTDVIVDQYIGAINFASDEGIIIGTSATTFEPEAGITYQDALTMVVRALGFGGSAMDAGYPWKYINKANELGLGEGISGVAYTDVLTRGQTAQILYNAFFAYDVNDATYAADVFNFSTVVITGTKNMKMVGAESISKKDYLSFNTLNANGTINDTVTYHLPVAAFQDAFDSQDLVDATVPENFVGASFRVTSTDGFKSLDVVIPCPAERFTEETLTTTAKSDADNSYIFLGEDQYKTVKSFTTLYNAQGMKGNTNEILAYATTGKGTTAGGYPKVDANYNILSTSGDIVAYYRPDITNDYDRPYVQKLDSGIFKPVDANDADEVAAFGGAWIAVTSDEYAPIDGNVYGPIASVNKHSTAIAYDDDNDGLFERVFYTYHTFAQFGRTTDGNNYATFDGVSAGTTGTFVDPEGLAIDAPAVGDYIRYSRNALSGRYTIYETYEVVKGELVSAVNGSNITIGGTTYALGVGNFPGTGSTGSSNSLFNKRVNYVVVDGNVVRITDAANNGKYIVFDNFIGMTTSGYGTALVYIQDKAVSTATIASIDGLAYQTYVLNANSGSLGNITDAIATGTLFYGTQDASGYWNLETRGGDFYAPVDAADVITFKNGIASSDSDYFYQSGAIKPFDQFITNGSTLYIVYNADKDAFYTTTGIPMDGATLTINDGGYMKLVLDGVTATYIYIYDGAIEGKTTVTSWAPYDYDAIIYVAPNTSESVGNSAAAGTLLGQVYYYGKVLDMISGNFISVYSGGIYNKKLEAGKFYTVKNGYVESEIEVFTEESPIQEGLLYYASNFNSIIVNTEGLNIELSAYTNLFTLNADKNVVDADGNGAADNSVTGAGAYYGYTPVYYYAGENTASRVILQITNNTDIGGTALLPLKAYKDAACTTKLAAAASVNYFNIGEKAYSILTAVNPKLEGRTENDNTYDKWMQIFKVDATTGEATVLKNWSIDFTTVTKQDLNGLPIAVGPTVYSMAISREFDEYDAANAAVAGDYIVKTMYNGSIYTMYVSINLDKAPIFLSGLEATIYNVDAFKGPVTLPSGGWINSVNDAFDPYTGVLDLRAVDFEDVWEELGEIDDTIDPDNYSGDYDELPIYVGQDGIMDTGRILLTGVKDADFSTNTYDVQIFVVPTTEHIEEAHGEVYSEPYSTRALYTYEQIFNSPVTFNDDGEAVVDIPGLYNMARVFVCSYEGCGHHTILTKDQYKYVIRVGSLSNDEWITLVEGEGAVYDNGAVVNEEAIAFAPDWNVRVYASILGDAGILDIEELVTYDNGKDEYELKKVDELTYVEAKIARTAEVVAYAYGADYIEAAAIDTINGDTKKVDDLNKAITGAIKAFPTVALKEEYKEYGLAITLDQALDVAITGVTYTELGAPIYTVTIGEVEVTVDADFDATAVDTEDEDFSAFFAKAIISEFGLGLDEAAVVINLDETQALERSAMPSTKLGFLAKSVRYNGWGAESITYAIVVGGGGTAGALSADNFAAASTGYVGTFVTDKNTFNNTVIFNNFEVELCKNFAISYEGTAYKSFAGTDDFPGFKVVKQVLPFEPYYTDIQFAENYVASAIDSQIFWISENLATIFG